MIKITNKDGITKEFEMYTTYYDISREFNVGKNILGVVANNEGFSLHNKATKDSKIEFIDYKDIYGNRIYKSGLEFIFQVALERVFPELEINYEHSVPKGFLGEIIGNKMLTQDDITLVKNEMAKIISDDIEIKKINVSKKEAIDFYKRNNEEEKALNILSISDKNITLYELLGHYNYFYSDMPYRTSSITKYEIVYLGRNRIVFIIPDYKNNGVLPEYVHYDNIINSFMTGKSWLNTLKMQYVSSINDTIGSGRIKDFIKSSELNFNTQIYNVVTDVINNKDIKFILIAGPSSSGKTTCTKRMSSYFLANGYDPICLSIDDFFKERDESPKDENGNFDFECLEAIDLELFNSTMSKLLNGEEVSTPTFNFILGKKEFNNNTIKLKENSILLIEGLHSLNDELFPDIDSSLKYKVYLSPFIPLNIDRHNYISTIDLRLIRRIIRDNRDRGYNVSNTIESWKKVRNGEEKYIFPFIHQADVIINTALPYEVGVLKVYAEPLLRSVGVESNHYEEARRLLNFLKVFYPIPGEYVNGDSILREFIGGRND